MSCCMKGQFAVDAADRSKAFQSLVQLRVPVHREQFAVRRCIAVLVDKVEQQVEQRYLELHFCLFACRLDPYCSVFGRFKIHSGQAAHIAIADARIAGEQKQIADEVKPRYRKRCSHQPLQLLAREITSSAFGARRLVPRERIGGDDTCGDGFVDDRIQARHVENDGARSQLSFRAQIKVKFVDEQPIQRGERNIRYSKPL